MSRTTGRNGKNKSGKQLAAVRRSPAARGGTDPAIRLPGQRAVYDALFGACAELTACAEALDAEIWFGEKVSALRERLPSDQSFHLALGDLVAEAERRRTVDAVVLLRTMAAAGPAGIADRAATAADRVLRRLAADRGKRSESAVGEGPALPRWIGLLGGADVGDCHLWTDVFGEYSQVYCEFVHHDGNRRHRLLVTIDHAFHGVAHSIDLVVGAKDLDLDSVVRDMERDARRGGGRFIRIAAAEAGDLLRAAFLAASDPSLPNLTTGPQPDRSFYAALPLAIRRVTAMPGGDLPPPAREQLSAAWTTERRAALIEDFLAGRRADFADPILAGQLAARIVDASIDVLGWPPDRLGQASVARLFGEVLPGTLVAPDVVLRQFDTVVQAWTEWLTEAADLPKKAHRILRRTTLAVLAVFPMLCQDRSLNPDYPYVADLPAEQAGGDGLQAVLDRRGFAVPFPGRRGDGLVDLPHPSNGLPAGQTHVDQLDAADEAHRRIITMVGLSAAGVDQREFGPYVEVVEQIWTDRPPALWQAATRLTATGMPRQRVLATLAETARRHQRNLDAAAVDDAGSGEGGAVGGASAEAVGRYLAALDLLGVSRRRSSR